MSIEREVHALNELHRIVELEYQNVINQLKKYVDKKVCLSDGVTSAKSFKINFLNIQPTKCKKDDYSPTSHVCVKFSGVDIWLNVKLCLKWDEHTCFYREANHPHRCNII